MAKDVKLALGLALLRGTCWISYGGNLYLIFKI